MVATQLSSRWVGAARALLKPRAMMIMQIPRTLTIMIREHRKWRRKGRGKDEVIANRGKKADYRRFFRPCLYSTPLDLVRPCSKIIYYILDV
jgi:hypothetical protein